MKNLVYFFLLVLLSNCSSKINISQQQDKVSVYDYLKSKGVVNNNVVVVKDYEEYKKLSRAGVLVIPEVTFFDGKGDLIEYKNIKKECSQDPYFFIKNYNKGKQLKFSKTVKLDMFASSYINLNDGSSINLTDKNKIYVFINWAIFTDKLNKDSFNLLAINNNDFIYILIDLDVQKAWNIPNKPNKK